MNPTHPCSCGKIFQSEISLLRHSKWHSEEYKSKVVNRKSKKKSDYETNPNHCYGCNSVIDYGKRANKFCSKSCAATYNNTISPKKIAEKNSCKHCGKTIKKISTFCNKQCNLDYRKEQTKKIVESGKARSNVAKQYLIDKFGEVCLDKDCAWDFNKRPIKVELEHINGDSTDNRLENLTLLCPNCHSLTDTYKSKNKGNGRFYRRQRYQDGKSF